jgi:integrase
LSRAQREELIARNVARLVELPTWEPVPVVPWSPAEALAFLQAAASDPLYPAFVLLLLYGMRRGEVQGLRWQDIDSDAATIRVRQQVQRIQGELHIGPVKTRAGTRDLPLLGLAEAAFIACLAAQDADRASSAPRGPTRALYSRPGLAGQSSRATWCARSPTSVTTAVSARSGCMPSDTQPRRSFAGGADLQVVKERLDHASIATTERYLHSLPTADETALDALSRIRSPQTARSA